MTDTKSYELLGLYEAYNTDGGGWGKHAGTIGFFSTEALAAKAANKEKDPYTAVRTVPAIKVDGKYFLLSHVGPVDVDNKERDRVTALRKQALDKLTPEEREALSIKE